MKTVDGRNFECNQCGACCRWQGKVFLTPEDIGKIALHMGIEIGKFLEKYTENYGGSTVLRNKEESQDCVMMDGDKCGVWGHHPKQCDEWPKKFDKRCPGFTNDGEDRMVFKQAVERVSSKLSAMQQMETSTSDQFYKGLMAGSEAMVTSKALAGGVDPYAISTQVKVASIDDLFAFHRASKDHLIHKSTRDLWSIDTDKDGGVTITRLFDNDGEPIKG